MRDTVPGDNPYLYEWQAEGEEYEAEQRALNYANWEDPSIYSVYAFAYFEEFGIEGDRIDVILWASENYAADFLPDGRF